MIARKSAESATTELVSYPDFPQPSGVEHTAHTSRIYGGWKGFHVIRELTGI